MLRNKCFYILFPLLHSWSARKRQRLRKYIRTGGRGYRHSENRCQTLRSADLHEPESGDSRPTKRIRSLSAILLRLQELQKICRHTKTDFSACSGSTATGNMRHCYGCRPFSKDYFEKLTSQRRTASRCLTFKLFFVNTFFISQESFSARVICLIARNSRYADLRQSHSSTPGISQ